MLNGINVQPPHICGSAYLTRPLRVLVIGNSLAWSPPQPVFDWTKSNGMDATDPASDYAHIVCNALAERRRQSVALMVVQAWGVETAANTGQPVSPLYAETVNKFAPDVVVVQFSDNVSATNATAFGVVYGAFLTSITWKRALVCVGAWYDYAAPLSAGIEANCVAHGGAFVEIGDLFLATDMRGGSFDSEINAGVGSHPNDMGHFEIARRIVLALENIL